MQNVDFLIVKSLFQNAVRERWYPQAQVRITSMWGDGVLVYLTSDGFVGVRLDGETRVDEYPGEHVKLA